MLIRANHTVTKTLILFNAVIDSLGLRFLPACDKYMHLFLDNANTGYAEVTTPISRLLHCAHFASFHQDTISNSPELTRYHRHRVAADISHI